MKVLILQASRNGGNTEKIADQFILGAKEAGHEVEKISLFTKKMNGCLGCEYCRNHDGICVWKDDLVEVNQKILESNVIVMVSAIYFYGISAQLKMVIDRTFNIEHSIHDKKIYFITSSAAPDEPSQMSRLQYAINSVQGWVDCLRNNCELVKVFGGWGMWQEPDVTKKKAYIEAYEEGKNL